LYYTMPTEPHPPKTHAWPRIVLRRSDQAVVAVLVAMALVGMAGWWLWQEGIHGGLVDVERGETIAIDFKIDVNQATWPELAVMPNVGEKLAKRIVADRAERGAFNQLADLERVSGIGPKTVEGMKPYLLLPSQKAARDQKPSTPHSR
jgi:competence protein ComEA